MVKASLCDQYKSVSIAITLWLPFLVSLTFAPNPSALAQGVTESSQIARDMQGNTHQVREAIDRLTDIQRSLSQRRQSIDEVKNQLKTTTDEDARKELLTQLDEHNKFVQKLNKSFEQILIGGIDLEAFSEQPSTDFDWQQELVQITEPLLRSLNELTEKPRKLQDLRNQIELYEYQLEVIQEALDSVKTFRGQTLPDTVTDGLEAVVTHWEERRVETEDALQFARYQLAALQGKDVSALEVTKEILHEFLQGRGLTLVIALVTAVVVWQGLRLLLWLVQKRPGHKNRKQRITRDRLLMYSFRLFTGFSVLLAVMTVFYARGDLLLLALSILGLAMLTLGLRQALPRYIAETRLLLNLGPVRSGERVVYNGLPMQVKSINIYSVLRNPDIEGIVRLPLGHLNALVSRPCGEEPWFPTHPGDYVLLADGRVGEVLRQTLELVQLRVAGSLQQFLIMDFLKLDLRNLSREGFGLAVTFGIDYRHQGICLEQVPSRFHRALTAALAEQGFSEDLESLLVDFKEAGLNSLDYLIYLTLRGAAAGSYFKLGRLVQQTCVDVCNQEGWGIPFSQLTLHPGEGFKTLSMTQPDRGESHRQWA